MKEKQKKFIELSKKHEALKERLKESKAELVNAMSVLGIGGHFQDESDGTVFQIVRPTGTYISFDFVTYERTKREGEAKGSMSKKKAEELGYSL